MIALSTLSANPYLNNLLMVLDDMQDFTKFREFRTRGGRWWWSCFCFNWWMARVLCKIWSKKATGYCESFLCLFLYINAQNTYKIAAHTYVINWLCVCTQAHVCLCTYVINWLCVHASTRVFVHYLHVEVKWLVQKKIAYLSNQLPHNHLTPCTHVKIYLELTDKFKQVGHI